MPYCAVLGNEPLSVTNYKLATKARHLSCNIKNLNQSGRGGAFNLAKNFRNKFLLSQRKFERSLDPNFRFSYILYTYSLLPQFEIGRSLLS